MRTRLINVLVLGASACIYACGGSTSPLLFGTGGAGGATMTGGNRGPGAFGDGITYGGGGGSPTTTPIGSGGAIDSDMCSGRYPGAALNCGGTTGIGYGGSIGFGGTTTTAPVSSGGIDSDRCSGRFGTPLGCGGAAGGGAGGSVPTPTDGGSSQSVLNLSLTWATSADAGAQLYNVVVMPDGTATCSEYRSAWLLIGREGQTDAQIAALLATPGTVNALATPCPLKVADVINSTITTTFVGGTKVDRLVFSSCSTDQLAALLADLRRIGELCVATGTMIRD